MSRPINVGYQGWEEACKVYGILRRPCDPPERAPDEYKDAWHKAMALCHSRSAKETRGG